jgi:hypothetical protein
MPTTTRIAIKTSASERVSILNTGNVGIGTDSPGYPLEIASPSTTSFAYQRTGVSANKWGFHSDNDATYWQNVTSGNLLFTLQNTGNVGIGTTSPGAKLENYIVSNSDSEMLRLTVAPADASGAKPKSIIGFYTPAETNTVTYKSGRITSKFDSSGYANTRVTLESLDSSGNFIETLSVKNGNVGIGTASPNTNLQVSGIGTAVGSTNYQTIISDNSSFGINKGGGIIFQGVYNSSGNESNFGAIRAGKTNTLDGNASSYLSLFYSNGGLQEGLRINNLGRVGIGTTNPQLKLQVASPSATSVVLGASYLSTNNNNFFEVGILANDGYLNLKNSGVVSTVHIDSDGNSYFNGGNVGIGTDSPNAHLDILNGLTGASLKLSATSTTYWQLQRDSATGNLNISDDALGNVMSFDQSTGNVGIGTTAPNYKLEVNKTSANNLTTALTLNNGSTGTNTAVALRLQTDPTSTVNSYSEIRSTRTNSPAAGGVAMRFLATNSTTGAASEIMRLSYVGLGLGTAGTTTITDTRRGAFADGTAEAPAYSFSDDTNNGMYRITTDTLGFSTAGSEKLRISSAGNVGIGTSNPGEKLDVNGNLIVSGNFNNLYVGGKTNSSVDGIRMLCAGDDSFIDCRGGSGLNFRLDDTTGDTQRIKFHSGGNVSIGNTNNSYKLDVTGTGNFAGNLQISTVDQQTTRLLLKNTNSTGGRTFALVGGVHNETQDGFSIYDTVAAATRFTILNNGDVGIGTTSPSQKLEVNGTIKATDYKGYLPAFQHGGFLHSASASSSYIYWIPTNSLSEVISSQYYNNWIAPYSGRVKKIIMKWTGPSAAPTATSVTFRYALYPNTSSDTFPATVVDGASTNMTVTKAFGDTDITFNAGDRVQLGFTTDGGTRLLQAFAYTVVLEYDKD